MVYFKVLRNVCRKNQSEAYLWLRQKSTMGLFTKYLTANSCLLYSQKPTKTGQQGHKYLP